MPVFSVHNVLPIVTSVVSALFLVTAGSHDLAPETSVGADSLARAEVQRCVANGRAADDCLDEADGKALIERAERLARAAGAPRREGAR